MVTIPADEEMPRLAWLLSVLTTFIASLEEVLLFMMQTGAPAPPFFL